MMNQNFEIQLEYKYQIDKVKAKVKGVQLEEFNISACLPVISSNICSFSVLLCWRIILGNDHNVVSVFCIHRKSYVWINIIFYKISESFDVVILGFHLIIMSVDVI